MPRSGSGLFHHQLQVSEVPYHLAVRISTATIDGLAMLEQKRMRLVSPLCSQALAQLLSFLSQRVRDLSLVSNCRRVLGNRSAQEAFYLAHGPMLNSFSL